MFHCLDVLQFIQSPIEEHPDYLQVLAVMIKAEINGHLHFFMDLSFPLLG